MKRNSEGSERRAAGHDRFFFFPPPRKFYVFQLLGKLLWKLVVKKQETVNYQTGSSLIHRLNLVSI